MTVRDIQATLQDLYHVEVSPSLISEVTDVVNEEVEQWRDRPRTMPISNWSKALSHFYIVFRKWPKKYLIHSLLDRPDYELNEEIERRQ